MIVVQRVRGRAATASITVVAWLALTAATALAGTPPHLVKDINPGSGPSDPFNIVNWNGEALFVALDPTRGQELRLSDGTAAGTHAVLDSNPGSGAGAGDYLPAKIGSDFVYAGSDGTHEMEPWISDGTSGGTHMIKDIDPSGSANPYGFTAWNGKVYFAATDGTHGVELYVTDGTLGRGPTASRTSTRSGPNASSLPEDFHALGNELLFQAFDGPHGKELWETDGTSSGTKLVKDINPGGDSSYPGGLVTVGGQCLLRRLR